MSNPVKTKAGHFFKDHGVPQKAWGLESLDNMTVSEIVDESDKRRVMSASRRQPTYKIAEYVMQNADINDPKSILKHANDRARDFSYKSGGWDGKSKIHASSSGWEYELKRFLNSYTVKDGNLHINFSADWKPHEYIGGNNVQVKFFKGRHKEIPIQDI